MPATLYLGAPGSGKTTLMRGHVASLIPAFPESVFLIVNHGERPDHPSWHDLPADHRVYGSVTAWWHDPCRVAIFDGVSGVEIARLAIAVGWSVYVDDECDGIVTDGKWIENPLREIVKRGRHLPNRAGVVTEVNALLATHRPANLPTDLSGLFDQVYVGRLYAWNDADRVRREGWANGRNVEEVQRVLDSQRPGEFLAWP